MEKVANSTPSCQSRPRGHAPRPPLRPKKNALDSLKKNVKTPFGKVSAASLTVEGEGARTSSPSRVSKLLEAWEKGLVGMDVTGPAPSAETRPSHSPIPTRRLLSAPDDAHSSHPASSKNSVSPSNLASVDAKQRLSPANARKSCSPAGRRQSPFSEDAKQSSSPSPQRPSGTAESQRSHCLGGGAQPPSLAPTQQPLSPAKARQTQVPPLPAGSSHSHSPVGRRYSPSRTENQSSSSLDDTQHSSSLSENRSSYSVADMRRFYSGGSIRQPPSPVSSMVETKQPFTPADSRSVSPSSDARSSPSPIGAKRSSPSSDTRCPFHPPVNGCSSSSASARCSASPAEVNCLPPPPDVIPLSSQADSWHSLSKMDTEGSPALVEPRGFSSTAVEGHSCSLSPRRNFTAHGPVFAQVYSRPPKPKDQLRTEAQDGKSTRVTESPGTTLCHAAVHSPGDAGFPKENHVTNTDGLQEEKNLAVSPDSIGGTMSQKESHMLNGDCSMADSRSLRESKLPGAIALRSSAESSPSSTLNATSFSGSSGGNHISSATSTKFFEEPCVFKPVPHVVSSSTVAKSQTQWYGPKGSSVVVLRAKQQVIVPQPGYSTIYQAGREIILSAPGSGNPSQGWQEKSPAPSSTTSSLLEENRQTQADLPDAESHQRIHSSFPRSCICSMPESQPENGMTHSQNASVMDAQRPRCVLVPSPACASNREATIVREGVTPFSTPQRDCSLPSKSASQKHSNLFAGSRSEPEQGMPNAGDPIANGSDQESSLLGVGKASLTANRRNKGPLDAAGETGISVASQQTSPGHHEARTQDELKEEQQTAGKGSPVFAPEQKGPPDGTLTSLSLPEPPRGNTRSSNQTSEQEPEEVEMEHFVDTLRNMDPADLRKPSKVLLRPPRPSILAKPKVLPPIDENHITPKSKVPLPAALGELFVLTEANSEKGTGPKGEEPGWAEEDTEEIENPYLSKEDKSWDCSIDRRSYSWENQQYKTEEEIGAFLGKLQRSPGDTKGKVIAPKAIVNQTNLIRSNILKGTSLLSNFVDRRVVEGKPYSRLDNSFLYSKFISPEKAEFKAPTKRKKMSSFVQKISRECQMSANGHQEDAVHKGLSPTALHFRAPDTNGNSRQIILLSKEAETLTQSEIQEKKPLKINKRPSKIILYSEAGFGGQKREIWSDVPDATSWELASTISIQVVRGGWLMYEKPRFHGRKCVLAEGNVEIANPWRMYCKKESERENAPFRIGSLKWVVQDYRLPEISFFSEENGEGRKQRFSDSVEDSRTYGRPLKAASIIVHSGLWLVYSKPFFDDDPYVLEPGGYPSLQAWGAKDPSICSMHPIKLGSPVVENPAEPKALIFERPHFQGRNWEVSRDIYNLKKPENNQDSMMSTAGSLKITGGCWVGYEKEGFRGHQYLLEEGEYCDWTEWGGSNEELVSLRLIRTDFLDPALVLFEAMDFEDGPSVELSEALPDVELASYGTVTQSIHVLSGVWVAYEGKNFSGEQYILEKGVYRNCEDWGASNCRIASVQPVQQVGECNLHFVSEIQLFSDPDLLGNSMTFKEDQASLPENFILSSCRVNGGSWILYDDHQFDGEQHILSEGEYPSLTSMGCSFTTVIHSLKKVPIFFSEPSIFLHGLECFEGKEIELNGEMRSLKAEGFNNHVLSVRVKGGIWVLCEHSDFRGHQWLLDCTEITNWLTYSGIQHIGSLYPIRQRRIYFRLKNQELKSFLSAPDDVEDMKAGRVLVSEINDKNSCIWYYEEGLMKNQVAPNMSLQVIGQAGKGTKVVLWSESRVPQQTWRIDSFGRICSQMFDDKVLDVKGGRTYDQDHAVIWDSSEERPTQIWDVQLL
ncbi:beta/gamma crystallin domain-containing protein 2 [Candoia aspera]|uniref:beta/gamma crystallin domain-containing protein 2 n=1 Tax=Candoia aspera TaxID=51853 RepID=UPI002FD7E321